VEATTRTFARVLAVQMLTPEEIALVNGTYANDASFTGVVSPDSRSEGKADDCQHDDLM
jgi:hypothetical protein